MTEQLTDKELYGSDIKLKEIAVGKFDFDVDRNGDFIEISGKDYMRQRIIQILFTRARYYPPQVPEYINNNETLRNNVDESGNHFFPGDLEELELPFYGSILDQLIGKGDSEELKVLIGLYIAMALAFEYQFGLETIVSMNITRPIIGNYYIDLIVKLVDNTEVKISFNA